LKNAWLINKLNHAQKSRPLLTGYRNPLLPNQLH